MSSDVSGLPRLGQMGTACSWTLRLPDGWLPLPSTNVVSTLAIGEPGSASMKSLMTVCFAAGTPP
jgi:hypothetical protein